MGKAPPSIDVRPAAGDDLAAVQALDARVLGDGSRAGRLAFAVAGGRCWVAHVGADLAGFVVRGEDFFERPFIALVVVAPERRRLGVATALLATVEAGCPGGKVFTSTNRSNLGAQRLFEARGYRHCGEIFGLDEDPEVIYVKRIG